MFAVSNLGLNMPGQQKPQGFNTSVGTSFGYGERHDPLREKKPIVNETLTEKERIMIDGNRNLVWPGVGTYDISKGADTNSNPKYK